MKKLIGPNWRAHHDDHST